MNPARVGADIADNIAGVVASDFFLARLVFKMVVLGVALAGAAIYHRFTDKGKAAARYVFIAAAVTGFFITVLATLKVMPIAFAALGALGAFVAIAVLLTKRVRR